MNEISSEMIKEIVSLAVNTVCDKHNISYRHSPDSIIINTTSHDEIALIERDIDLFILTNYKKIIENKTNKSIREFNTNIRYYDIFLTCDVDDINIKNKHSIIIKF